jgi:tRNA pseudouridine55 synthase
MIQLPEGFLLVDKPTDWTSFDVVAKLRRITGIRKIGHAGTLDPFATGLLVVGVGRGATKHLDALMGQRKEYFATARLGATSDTQDLTGEITATPGAQTPTITEVETALAGLRGEQAQIPPMYSAIKIGGKKLYDLARAGQTIERQPRRVTIHELDLLGYEYPELRFRVVCSPGTYIRTLAHDLGGALGTGAYLVALRRTKSGDKTVDDAAGIADLTPENWRERLVPIEQLLPDRAA